MEDNGLRLQENYQEELKILLKIGFIQAFEALLGKVYFSLLFIFCQDKNKKVPEINDLFMSNRLAKKCIEDKLTEYINDCNAGSE